MREGRRLSGRTGPVLTALALLALAPAAPGAEPPPAAAAPAVPTAPLYVERANLRIEESRFCKAVLRDRRLTIGRIDARFTTTDLDAVGETGEFDPSLTRYDAPFSLAHMLLPAAERPRIRFAEYDCGHMVYTRPEDHRKLKADVAGFLREATGTAPER